MVEDIAEWISVEERLPDTELGEYPVKAKQETKHGTWTYEEAIHITWANGDKEWHEYNKYNKKTHAPPLDITHWKPNPPGKKSNG